MLILGIDPGLARIGYGLVENKGNKFKVIDYGTIITSSEKEDVKRLQILYNKITNLINKFNPDHMAVEELFFNKNVKTAIRVGQARGVILLCGSESNLKVAEYTPLQIKQAVVGYGRAHKHQVQQMVKALLNLKKTPESDDAADALAVSICHGHSYAAKEKWGTSL
ncbi:MAG: crossover junction endodeoxyribonuclease RuvC [Bacillota bacterium]